MNDKHGLQRVLAWVAYNQHFTNDAKHVLFVGNELGTYVREVCKGYLAVYF